MNQNANAVKSSKFSKMMRLVERVGNKLPHPFILFTIFSIIILFLSLILNHYHAGITYYSASKTAGEAGKMVTVTVANLLSKKNMQDLVRDIPTIYVNFPSLKVVILMMLGIGFIDETGFFTALMRKYLLRAPRSLVTAALVFVAVNANLMSDAGTIFSLTMGGVLFAALGRNPKIGVILGYAACSGGFTANMFLAGTDALLAGITEQTTNALGLNVVINPLCNYYFMSTATLFLTLTLTIFTEKVIVKMTGDTEGQMDEAMLESYKITPAENKGLKYAGMGFLAFLAIMAVLCVPSGAFFRNAQNGFLPKSPLLSSIVVIIFALFALVGIPYGVGVGKIKTSRDVPKIMQKGLSKAIPPDGDAAVFLHLHRPGQ